MLILSFLFCFFDVMFYNTICACFCDVSGLMMYNAGKGQDFIAVEIVNGHIHYVFNLGYGSISIKDNCPHNLNDNQWHSVTVGRPSKFKHTLLVDSHLAAANSR